MPARFPADLHVRRRAELLARLGDDTVAVLPAGGQVFRHRDVAFEFRPDGDFAYLTGFGEPDAVAVLTPFHPEHRFVLFVAPRDPERERWDGPRAGLEGARRTYGADAAFPVDELPRLLGVYLAGARRVVAPWGRHPAFDALLGEQLRRFAPHPSRERPGPVELVDPQVVVGEMRLVKGPEELELLRRAAAVAVEGQRAAFRAALPGRLEYEVQAEVEAAFRRRGAAGTAFATIVASGPNACVLHHTRNDRRIAEGDLVLVDAGPDLAGYVSDLTRTFPAAGRFSAPQRRVYEVVLAAQRAVLAVVRPGVPWDRLQAVAARAVTEGLLELGLLAGEAGELVEEEAWQRYYPHSIGHWVGLDLRDSGRYRPGGAWRTLEPGMTFTVEPGVYVPPDDPHRDLAGIGVRIEDVVAVTEDGCEVLSGALPTDPGKVERAVGAARRRRPGARS
jgi:Xaa-Pro aminopeptidase